MNFTDKVILTCAVTGGMSFNRAHPHVPITPQEIADSALSAAKAGASVVHLHVRDPETGEGSQDPKLYREVVDRIRDSSTDVVINLTCGGSSQTPPMRAGLGLVPM